MKAPKDVAGRLDDAWNEITAACFDQVTQRFAVGDAEVVLYIGGNIDGEPFARIVPRDLVLIDGAPRRRFKTVTSITVAKK